MPVSEKELGRFYFPGRQNPEIDDRKRRFAELNEFVRSRNGWITSIPGARAVTIEALPGSTLPDELLQRGFQLEEAGEVERIIDFAITERFTQSADGSLSPLTAGATRAAKVAMDHAAIARTMRYTLKLAE